MGNPPGRRAVVLLAALLVFGLLPLAPAGATVPHDPDAPAPVSFTQVAVGNSFTCGLDGHGAAWCWGNDGSGQLGNGAITGSQVSPSPVDTSALPAGTTFTQLGARLLHACGLTSSGTVWCWGRDADGQLGNGAITGDQVSPSPVDTSLLPAGTRFTQLSVGVAHTCALSSEGIAYCWGSDGNGRLGNGGTSVNRASPVPVDMPPDTTFTQVSAGSFHTCALASDGTAYCWGSDGSGELGNGAGLTADQQSPSLVAMPLGATFTHIVAGSTLSCAVTGAGDAYCWGNDGDGQLGNGAITGNQHSPSLVDGSDLPAGATFTQIAIAFQHTCGVLSSGAAWCWGLGTNGRLGYGPDTTGSRSSPNPVDTDVLPAGTTFTQLSAEASHACGVTSSGTVWCWGHDGSGALGNGPDLTSIQVSPSPVDTTVLPVGAAFVQVTAGEEHSCGLTGAGAAYCWGRDNSGQLGNGSITGNQASPSPVVMPEGVTFTEITAGRQHTCALTGSGTAYCWGSDGSGRLGNGSGLTADQTAPSAVTMPAGVTFTRISAGDSHTCATTSTGNAYCWGLGFRGRLGNDSEANRASPSPVTMPSGVTFTQVSAGDSHACATTSTGTAYCWGIDGFGRLGNGPGLTADQATPSAVTMPTGVTFTQVAGGATHTCASTSTGTAYCWGNDGSGQLGNGASTGDQPSPSAVAMPAATAFTQLAAGSFHTCATTSAGTAYCWGSEGSGRLGNGATGGNQAAPAAVAMPAATTFTQITAGWFHTCATTSNGTAACWGHNGSGRLGNGASTGNQSSPSAVDVGVSVALDDRRFTLGDEVALEADVTRVGPAAWQWYRDGAAVAGETDPTYVFDPTVDDEDVVFSVTVTNVFDETDSDTATLALNGRPVADAGGPYTVTEGRSVALDATGSTDPDDDALTFAWELDTGTTRFDDPTSPTPRFDANGLALGDYTLTLTVDDDAATDTGTATLTVRRAPSGTTPEPDPEPTSPPDLDPGSARPEPTPPPAPAPPLDATTCPPTTFTDTAGNPHNDAIAQLGQLGVACGQPNGAYRPAEPVRRDQLATLLVRTLTAAGHVLPPSGDAFTDLPGNVHADAVGRLQAAGIVNGTTVTTFGPDQPVTRAQIAALLVRALGWAGVPVPAGGASPFTDTFANPHASAIDTAYEVGLTHGTTPTTYSPSDPARRGQTATLLLRLHQLL